MKIQFVIASLGLLWFSACSNDPVLSETETLELELAQIVDQSEVPGAAFGLIKDDQLLWESYHGFSNLNSETEVDANTVFNVASISKLVTATAAMQLYEGGILDLDQDINEFIDFPIAHPQHPELPITTRMLLSHRSGMAWPDGAIVTDFYVPYRAESAPTLRNWLQGYLQKDEAWTSNAPGRFTQYSNIGIAMVGYIVSVLTDMDFKDYCQVEIFDKIGMPHTQFSYDYFDNSTNFAVPYPLGYQYSSPFYPSSSLKTTLPDLSRFLITYMNGGEIDGNRILTPLTISEMIDTNNEGYGLVWLDQGRGRGHGGAYFGATTFLDFDPGSKVGFIGFINYTTWEMSDSNTLYPDGTLYKLIQAKQPVIISESLEN